MTLQNVLDEIKFNVTGGLLELEIPNSALTQLINQCVRELNRYYNMTRFVTVPFLRCIDLSSYNVHSVQSVRRSEATASESASGYCDPMMASQWQMLSGYGNMGTLNDYAMNYAAWTTLQQLRNTTSTDMSYKFDSSTQKLYVNVSCGNPSRVTVEYIPLISSVEDIDTPYWCDVLVRLCTARLKVVLGRIRTRFKQSNALWESDGDTMINEGTTELNELLQELKTNDNLYFVMD